MVNYYAYENEFVFTLPQKVQDNILDTLNFWHEMANDYLHKSYVAESSITRDYCEDYYRRFKEKQEAALTILARMEIFPVIGWRGHQDTYFFPSRIDCEIEEERYWQDGE